MKILGLIPARLGSTGVKKKNIRLLAGRPLIEYTIEAALRSNLDRTILTTEAEEIAEIGAACGVEVPFLRPAELATDEAKAMDVTLHALDFLERADGYVPDAVIYLQPTSPFRDAAHIDEAIEIARSSNRDSVLSVAVVAEHPAFMFVPDSNGGLKNLNAPVGRTERRQDLPPVYSYNGAIAISRTSFLRSPENVGPLFENYDDFAPLLIEPPVTVDINTEQDFLFADFLMQTRNTFPA